VFLEEQVDEILRRCAPAVFSFIEEDDTSLVNDI
jgi:hypothetical protein